MIPITSMAVKLLVTCLSRTRVFHADRLTHCINRLDRPLLTVSNHTSPIDDPFLWAAILKWRELLSLSFSDRMRWTLGAREVLFTNPFYRWYFGNGRVIPVDRGAGVLQPAVDSCIERLQDNGWVHVFPEGMTVPTSDRFYTRLKWGVGRMISETLPILVPVRHFGLEHVKPLYQPKLRLFQPVDIIIGEPIDTRAMSSSFAHLTVREKWSRWAMFVADRMNALKRPPSPS